MTNGVHHEYVKTTIKTVATLTATRKSQQNSENKNVKQKYH